MEFQRVGKRFLSLAISLGRAAPALAAALALAACVSSGGQTGVGAREAGATADMGVAGSYMLGAPYQRGGATVTPAESFTYRDLGYAEVLGSDSHPTANGGQYDPDALMGAHGGNVSQAAREGGFRRSQLQKLLARRGWRR